MNKSICVLSIEFFKYNSFGFVLFWLEQQEFKQLPNHTISRLNLAVCQQFHRHRQFYTIQHRCRHNMVIMNDTLHPHTTEQPEIQVKFPTKPKINKNKLKTLCWSSCSPIQCSIHAKWTKFASGSSSRYVSKHDITISHERCYESTTVQSTATVEQSEHRTHFINIELSNVSNSEANVANWSNWNKSECR